MRPGCNGRPERSSDLEDAPIPVDADAEQEQPAEQADMDCWNRRLGVLACVLNHVGGLRRRTHLGCAGAPL